jgi:hypothetical protein
VDEPLNPIRNPGISKKSLWMSVKKPDCLFAGTKEFQAAIWIDRSAMKSRLAESGSEKRVDITKKI